MALIEFYCQDCKKPFEQITSSTDPDRGVCPTCHGKKTKQLISTFRIGGRGDLRESTLHGCHDNYDGMSHHDHDHSHHDHGGHDDHGSGSDHSE